MTTERRLPPMQQIAIRFCRLIPRNSCVMEDKKKSLCTSRNCIVVRQLQDLRKRLSV